MALQAVSTHFALDPVSTHFALDPSFLLTHDDVTAPCCAACCAKVVLVHESPCSTLSLINPIKSTNETLGETLREYGRRESNPCLMLGKHASYH